MSVRDEAIASTMDRSECGVAALRCWHRLYGWPEARTYKGDDIEIAYSREYGYCSRCSYERPPARSAQVAIECSDRYACDLRIERTAEIDAMLRAYRRRHGLPEPIEGNN